jgi:hypothetical protein
MNCAVFARREEWGVKVIQKPRPALGLNDNVNVLVKVIAAGVNPVDAKFLWYEINQLLLFVCMHA